MSWAFCCRFWCVRGRRCLPTSGNKVILRYFRDMYHFSSVPSNSIPCHHLFLDPPYPFSSFPFLPFLSLPLPLKLPLSFLSLILPFTHILTHRNAWAIALFLFLLEHEEWLRDKVGPGACWFGKGRARADALGISRRNVG